MPCSFGHIYEYLFENQFSKHFQIPKYFVIVLWAATTGRLLIHLTLALTKVAAAKSKDHKSASAM